MLLHYWSIFITLLLAFCITLLAKVTTLLVDITLLVDFYYITGRRSLSTLRFHRDSSATLSAFIATRPISKPGFTANLHPVTCVCYRTSVKTVQNLAFEMQKRHKTVASVKKKKSNQRFPYNRTPKAASTIYHGDL